ncbi:putative peptidoglycan-binding domain-containing protein [Bacillus sp. B-TM1]
MILQIQKKLIFWLILIECAVHPENRMHSRVIKVASLILAKRGKDGEKVMLKILNIMQGQRYIEICERNPTQEQFFYGWISNRIA